MKIISWNDLPAILMQNDRAECTVTLHGAHVVSYIPAGMSELLFVSKQSEFTDGKAIRGGVPVCFPWFGAPPPGESKAHGIVRCTAWEVLAADDSHAVLGITVNGFRLRYTVTAAEKLQMVLHIENISGSPLDYSGALHTYFRVADVSALSLDGIAGSSYLDSLTGKFEIQDIPLQITCETDRIYQSNAAVVLDDPGFKRRITVEKSGSNSTVIWNPWIDKSKRLPDFGDDEFHNMLCIEAANAAAVGDTRTLAPGECAELSQTVSVQHY